MWLSETAEPNQVAGPLKSLRVSHTLSASCWMIVLCTRPSCQPFLKVTALNSSVCARMPTSVGNRSMELAP